MGVYLLLIILYDDVLKTDYCFMKNVLNLFVTNLSFTLVFLFLLQIVEFIIYLTIYFMFYRFGKESRATNSDASISNMTMKGTSLDKTNLANCSVDTGSLFERNRS